MLMASSLKIHHGSEEALLIKKSHTFNLLNRERITSKDKTKKERDLQNN